MKKQLPVRRVRTEDQSSIYKYHPPAKDYDKYKSTKIKVIQDINTHKHHEKHPLNIYFNQYNEFIKLVFKNVKSQAPAPFGSTAQKVNQVYVMGLARALGLNLRKDAFSELNMKSREHQA
jgi:hypothetical protein